MEAQHIVLYGQGELCDVQVQYFCGIAKQPWENVLHEETLHIILNLSTNLIIFDDHVRLNSLPGTITMWHRGKNTNPHIAQVSPAGDQELLVISAPYVWLDKTFGSQRSALHPSLQAVFDQSSSSTELGKIRAMLVNELNLAREMISPPVLKPAQKFWYAAKIMEVMTLHLFTNTNTHNNTAFCSQIKSSNQRRITLAMDWLNNHLDQTLDLKALADHLGCTPQYISKIFSEHTGKTLKLSLRRMRIERAAKLLSDGDYNVTEAAMEVGYNSLSHFSKAFVLEMGVKPSQYS